MKRRKPAPVIDTARLARGVREAEFALSTILRVIDEAQVAKGELRTALREVRAAMRGGRTAATQ